MKLCFKKNKTKQNDQKEEKKFLRREKNPRPSMYEVNASFLYQAFSCELTNYENVYT